MTIFHTVGQFDKFPEFGIIKEFVDAYCPDDVKLIRASEYNGMRDLGISTKDCKEINKLTISNLSSFITTKRELHFDESIFDLVCAQDIPTSKIGIELLIKYVYSRNTQDSYTLLVNKQTFARRALAYISHKIDGGKYDSVLFNMWKLCNRDTLYMYGFEFYDAQYQTGTKYQIFKDRLIARFR